MMENESRAVSVSVNGRHHEVLLEPRVSLLDALRETLHLTGTKKGCNHGACGACTVLVNGTRINACLALRSEEHTSELQSHSDLVCRLLLEKKKTPLKARRAETPAG